MIAQYNPFLGKGRAVGTKGGPDTIERPGDVDNIVFQTRGAPLDAFEDGLADVLMAVFAAGAEEIDDVVAGLNAAGSVDRAGAAWTARSFTDQMAASAAALFAVTEENVR